MANQPLVPDPRTPGSAPAFGPDDDTVPSANAGGVYREYQQQNYAAPSGGPVEKKVDVYQDENVRKASLRNWITRIIYFLLGVLEVILGLRFIFRLLGANQASSFTLALYDFSHVFVGPFNGIFNDQAIGSRSVFELSTLVAMLIYALIGWGLVSLCRVLFTPSYGKSQRISTTWRR
jgi:uncharacterized membrane protein YuzA (DUF378 family)